MNFCDPPCGTGKNSVTGCSLTGLDAYTYREHLCWATACGELPDLTLCPIGLCSEHHGAICVPAS